MTGNSWSHNQQLLYIVAGDALVLKQQVISIHNIDATTILQGLFDDGEQNINLSTLLIFNLSRNMN